VFFYEVWAQFGHTLQCCALPDIKESMDIKTLDCQKVLETLSKLHGELKNLKVASLFLFGSVVRNQARPGSDIDFLVEFSEPIGLFDIINLKIFLEKTFNHKVDVVPRDGLREEFKDEVLKEAIRAA